MLDVEFYVKEVWRQLNYKENYETLNCDPTTANNETVNKVISRFQKENLFCENISEGIKRENPRLHIVTWNKRCIKKVIPEDLWSAQ